MIRHNVLVVAFVVVMTLAGNASAQFVNVSLDLSFNDPADFNSGGDWTVVAATFGGGTLGLSDISLLISDADFSGDFLVPSSIFPDTESSFIGNVLQIETGADLANPVFGVGVVGGPLLSTFVDPVGIAPFGDNLDLGSFTGATPIASGSFAPGNIPEFVPILGTPDGNLFSDSIVFVDSGGIVSTIFQSTVRSVAVVPEPNGFALLLMGLMGVSTRRSRTR